MLAFRNLNMVGHARSLVQSRNLGDVQLSHLDPLRRESVDRSMQLIADHFGRLDGVILLPQKPNGEYGYSLTTANDEDAANFVRDEIVAPVAFASALLETWINRSPRASRQPSSSPTHQTAMAT